MQDTVKRLLTELGEDPSRDGLLDTPKRVDTAQSSGFRGRVHVHEVSFRQDNPVKSLR